MLSHVTPQGQPTMVNVSEKPVTHRTAKARAELYLPDEVKALFDGEEIQTKKGPVFHTAIIAGTQAAKKTPDLIPFCHALPLESCEFTFSLEETLLIDCTVAAHYKTGVEMEALTGATVAALTVYDMCKAVSHAMEIQSVRLISKRGGKHDV